MAGYSVTYSVVDNATKQIDAINRRLAAMHAPVERMSKSISRFIDVSGLRRVGDAFGWIQRTVSGLVRSLTSMVPVLGAITGAATITGMVKLVGSFAAWGKTLQTNAAQIGITTQELQQLQDAVTATGGDADDMTESLKGLKEASTGAFTGTNVDAASWFARAGIAIRDANGHLRSTTELLPDVIKYLDGLKDPTDRARAAQAMLGDAQAKLYYDWKTSGIPTFEEFLAKGREYQALTDGQVASLRDYRVAMGGLTTSFNVLGEQVGATLAKALTPFVNKLAEFVHTHQPQIIAAVKQIVDAFTNWLQGVDWSKVQAGIQSVIDSLQWVVTHLDTVKDTVEAIAAAFAAKWAIGIVADIAKVVVALGPLGAALVPISAALALITTYERNKSGQQAIEEQAKGMGFEQKSGGLFGMPTFHNPTTGETLTYDEMLARQGRPHGGGLFGGGAAQESFRPGPMNLPGGAGKGMDVGRAAAIRDRLAKDLDISPAAASGIVGNLQAESGLQAINERNPVVPGSRGGFGWAQWTGPRRTAFEAYAKEQGFDPKSDEANYGFLVQELKSKQYAGLLAQLREGKITPGEAAAKVERQYEAPLIPNAAPRIVNADRIASAKGPAAPAQQVTGLGADWAIPHEQIQAQGPPAQPPATGTITGSVDVNITHRNPPPNSAVTATGTGAVNVPPPKVEQASMASI